MTFRLFVDSSNGVDVNPEWDFKEQQEKIENRHRTRDGSEYVYKWGEFTTLKFKVTFVNSSFKSIVNSWWNTNTNLLWMEEGGTAVTSVQLINKTQPVDSFMKPYTDLFGGTLEIGTY